MRTLPLLPFLIILGTAWAHGAETPPDPLFGGDPKAGEIWYEQSCAACHRSPGALVRGGDDIAVQAQALDAFLTNHRAPNADMRRDLIAFLLLGSPVSKGRR